MPGIATETLVRLRDAHLEAYTLLASGAVSSYSSGDQSYTMLNIDALWAQIQRLERQIAAREGRATPIRPDFRRAF